VHIKSSLINDLHTEIIRIGIFYSFLQLFLDVVKV
jgi:hypothetical protein